MQNETISALVKACRRLISVIESNPTCLCGLLGEDYICSLHDSVHAAEDAIKLAEKGDTCPKEC